MVSDEAVCGDITWSSLGGSAVPDRPASSTSRLSRALLRRPADPLTSSAPPRIPVGYSNPTDSALSSLGVCPSLILSVPGLRASSKKYDYVIVLALKVYRVMYKCNFVSLAAIGYAALSL